VTRELNTDRRNVYIWGGGNDRGRRHHSRCLPASCTERRNLLSTFNKFKEGYGKRVFPLARAFPWHGMRKRYVDICLKAASNAKRDFRTPLRR